LLQTRAQGEAVRFGDATFGGGDTVLPAKQSDGPGGDVSGVSNTNPVNANVVVSGWQIYDNKGKVVEKYEPFFSEGWEYAAPTEDQKGQKARMYYDPRGQVIRTVNPDGSEQCVIYGVPGTRATPNLTSPEVFVPTPWEAYTYDANDNAGRTHAAAAIDYRHHWDTPTSIVIDALGRTVVAVERNRGKPTQPTAPLPPTEEYRTSSTYDMRGNLLTVTDALGRLAFQHVYDLANRPLRIKSIDAGIRRTVLDAAGNVIEARDSKEALVLRAYDALSRPIHVWARDGSGQTLTLRERIFYGDNPASGLTRSQAMASNLLGTLYQHYDEAGLLTCTVYDFKGNMLEKDRRVIGDDEILKAFAPAATNNWQVQAYRVDWQPPPTMTLSDYATTLLESTRYETSVTYDALNRVKVMQYPQDVGESTPPVAPSRKALRPHYNRAGALERVELDGTIYVEHIVYNAKGQRTLIAYGNGVMTRYAYDLQTFRLVRLRTERYTKPDPLTYQPDGGLLQELAYSYDLAGNILSVVDRTPGCGVLNNPDGATTPGTDPMLARILANDPRLRPLLIAGDVLIRLFTYDPLSRLLSATGRESNTFTAPRPWEENPLQRQGFNSGNHGTPNQDNAPHLTVKYREEYAYDPAGNMVLLKHRQNGNPWTRHFGMGGLTPQQWAQEWPTHLNVTWPNPPGNHLTHVGDNQPGVPQTHVFDLNGNLTEENNTRHFEWDHSDRMRVFRTQPNNAPPSVYTHYLYDASGQRVKKLVRKGANDYEVTIYIDGVFERHRLVKPSETVENNTLHVMDNQSHIALLRVGDAFPADGAPNVKVKYHLGDHLGSSNVVIGGATAASNAFINREEYFPYGETSFGSFARKRYRFTGKERDEESGLYYHGARYYMPWLARWGSCDPAGMIERINVYVYCRSNPLRLKDTHGLAARDVMQPEQVQVTVPNPKAPPLAAKEEVKKLTDPESIPTTALEKIGGKDPLSSADHAEKVLKTINHFISEATKITTDTKTGKVLATKRQILYQATIMLANFRESKPPSTSENLIYRDADHYLAGRIGEFTHTGPDEPVSEWLQELSPLVILTYDVLKELGFYKQVAFGGKNIVQSGATDPAAVGGQEWALLGVADFFRYDANRQLEKAAPTLASQTPIERLSEVMQPRK
jgi:RHS repeat-associated protein